MAPRRAPPSWCFRRIDEALAKRGAGRVPSWCVESWLLDVVPVPEAQAHM